MKHEDVIHLETGRVRDLMAEAIDQVTADGGDIRFFSAALLTAAIQLHAEVEGTESLDRAITKIATRELQRTGAVGSC